VDDPDDPGPAAAGKGFREGAGSGSRHPTTRYGLCAALSLTFSPIAAAARFHSPTLALAPCLPAPRAQAATARELERDLDTGEGRVRHLPTPGQCGHSAHPPSSAHRRWHSRLHHLRHGNYSLTAHAPTPLKQSMPMLTPRGGGGGGGGGGGRPGMVQITDIAQPPPSPPRPRRLFSASARPPPCRRTPPRARLTR